MALEAVSSVLAHADRLSALGARRDERRVAASLRAMGAGTGRRGRRTRETVGWAALSPAERTVARMVADGLSNHEIGASLRISPRTVESHIGHALNKLSVRNRVELAATVGRQGLTEGGGLA